MPSLLLDPSRRQVEGQCRATSLHCRRLRICLTAATEGGFRFFCIVHIFILPILVLNFAGMSVSAIRQAVGRCPSLTFLDLVELIGNIGVAVFGVYAGISLRRLRRGAVGVAKVFLIASLVWMGLRVALVSIMVGYFPPKVGDAMAVAAIKGVV